MAFTVFQDVPAEPAVKAKPANVNVMATRSSARLNAILQGSSNSNEPVPLDKENVHPVTGERVGTAPTKKRKTNVLAVKASVPTTNKKIKSLKVVDKDSQSQPKKRKTIPDSIKPKVPSKRDGKVATSRKSTATKRVTRSKVSQLPRLEEEAEVKGDDTERITQATIDSRCYELTVQPLADVSQAYEASKSVQEAEAETSPGSKAKFRKAASSEPEIRDFFTPSQTLLAAPVANTRPPSAEPTTTRKFSTPERKQIYAAFTFSTPSPASERFSKATSRADSIPRLELA